MYFKRRVNDSVNNNRIEQFRLVGPLATLATFRFKDEVTRTNTSRRFLSSARVAELASFWRETVIAVVISHRV